MFQPAGVVTLPYEFISSDGRTHVSLRMEGEDYVMESNTCPWSIIYRVPPSAGDIIHISAGRMLDYYKPGELGGLCGDCNAFPND